MEGGPGAQAPWGRMFPRQQPGRASGGNGLGVPKQPQPGAGAGLREAGWVAPGEESGETGAWEEALGLWGWGAVGVRQDDTPSEWRGGGGKSSLGPPSSWRRLAGRALSYCRSSSALGSEGNVPADPSAGA